MSNSAEVELTDTQIQVDRQIEARLQRICFAEWKAHSNRKDGTRIKKPGPLSYSQTVQDLLELRQLLYSGECAPQDISADLQFGEIREAFLKAK